MGSSFSISNITLTTDPRVNLPVDHKIASLTLGFTAGFSTLCIWNVIQLTTSLSRPVKSIFIWMVWGEIIANIGIAAVGWLYLEETVGPSIPILFAIVTCWVFEVQLLMQIIINRIAVVLDNKRLVSRVKWSTAAVITCVNVSVYVIWIPADIEPPPIPLFVTINTYYDPITKLIVLMVDAALNIFFLRTVRTRLIKYHDLEKYSKLVRFNARLMVVSISMDIMLILLMFYRNHVVFVQFHPVAYMIKLNIELTMASLITQIAKATVTEKNTKLGRYPYACTCGSVSTPSPLLPYTPIQSRFPPKCMSPTFSRPMGRVSEDSVMSFDGKVDMEHVELKADADTDWRSRRMRRNGSIGRIRWEDAVVEGPRMEDRWDDVPVGTPTTKLPLVAEHREVGKD